MIANLFVSDFSEVDNRTILDKGFVKTSSAPIDGMGCLDFDEDLAHQEDLIMKKQVKYYTKSTVDKQLHELWVQ